jgi:accessory colonization factor AcfC
VPVRKAARRDASEPAIIAYFEAHGCAVQQLSQQDIPDLAVTWFPWSEQPDAAGHVGPIRSKVALVEVKSGKAKLRELYT